jgi:zinc-finger of transposase IS204/IS1001/IS1096/IS1165
VVSNTTKLPGLAGVQVTGVEVGDDGVPRVALATNDENARRCPSCGFASRSVHPNATTHPRDLAVADRKTALTWHKRRWWCLEASCARKTFTEQIKQVPAGARVTGRLRDELGADVGDMGRTVTEVIPTTCFGWIGHRWVSRTPATWNAGPLVEGFWLRMIRCLERLRVFSCALTLDVDRETVWYVARLLSGGRRRRGTRRGMRVLAPFERALFGLAWLRDQCDVGRLGAGFGLSRATAYRCRDEVLEVLSDQAPDPREARDAAKAAGCA